MRQLKFLSDNNLVKDIKKRYTTFSNEINKFQDLIEKEKLNSEISALDTLIMTYFKNMNCSRIA